MPIKHIFLIIIGAFFLKNSFAVNQGDSSFRFNEKVTLVNTKGGSFLSFYKKYISSQDGSNVCSFYPSCSSYMQQQISLNGFVGLLLGIDRLCRCNGHHHEFYKSKVNKLPFDPVKKR